MKIAGVIAEYNPFHNGHYYQLEQIKQKTGADYIVVVMSGDFLQRGVPALTDKYARTKMALSAGADLVIELPCVWATASAEYFAQAGVRLLQKMGNVTHLCFGAECDDLDLLLSISSLLSREDAAYQNFLSQNLKKGLSFPAARSQALSSAIENDPDLSRKLPEITLLLASPNNILALEYLKALQQTSSDPKTITPVLIPRKGDGYHTPDIHSTLASATAIRKALFAGQCTQELSSLMPETTLQILDAYQKEFPFLDENSPSQMLAYRLFSFSEKDYDCFADCSHGLSNRIRNQLGQYQNIGQFTSLLKTKEITYSRISRALIHILLDIRNSDYDLGQSMDWIPYLRILGFRKSAGTLLSDMKKEASVPFITKVADASTLLASDAYSFFKKDLFAADLYRQLMIANGAPLPKNEFTQGLILIDS